MNNIICRGDVHGDAISAFSYRTHPWLRDCYNDAFIVCGDFGIPFGVAAPYYLHNGYKSDKYQLDWLQEKLENHNNELYIVLGNHDDRVAAMTMPLSERYMSDCIRVMRLPEGDCTLYPNIFLITNPCWIPIKEKGCFFIPGGVSHDAKVILDPNSATFKQDLKREKKLKKNLWRIKDWEWWPDEVVDVSMAIGIARNFSDAPKLMDYIFSHEAPAMINKWFKRPGDPGRRNPTEGEKGLQEVYNILPPFKHWYHGHYHFTDKHPYDILSTYDAEKPISCVYNTFVDCGTGEYLG